MSVCLIIRGVCSAPCDCLRYACASESRHIFRMFVRVCGYFVVCDIQVCVYVCVWVCLMLLWWAPVYCVPLLTRLPTAAPACEKLLLGPFNGETFVWEKVAKSWEKRALSRRGREGVNHEWTCLYLNTHSCGKYTHTYTRVKKWTLENAQRNPKKQTCSLFCQRDKTWTIQNLTHTKRIYTAASHRIMATLRHTSHTHAITRSLITQTVYG